MVHAYAHASWRAAAPRQTSTTARKHNRKPCFDGAAPAAARASRRAEAARHVVAAASDTSSAAPSSPKVSTGPGRQTYKPASYSVLVSDAVTALQAAIAEGHTLCEIEFPPLPSKTDSYKGSSDVFIDANIQLALAAAKKARKHNTTTLTLPQGVFSHLPQLETQLSSDGKTVQILVPDAPELQRAEERFKGAVTLLDGVSFGALCGQRATGLAALLGGLTTFAASPAAGLTAPADVYLVVNLSCVELVPFETFVNERMPKGSTAVAFNLELDTQRGDLGLPGFPGKDLHHRFLSRFLPVLYLRPRDYSKTVAVAPFLLNYSGATFREYPGPWQVMLRADSGELACIAERRARYALGEAKEEMLAAMGLNTEEEGSSLAFLRRGYKTATWWEEANELEASTAWRS